MKTKRGQNGGGLTWSPLSNDCKSANTLSSFGLKPKIMLAQPQCIGIFLTLRDIFI